MEINNYLVAQTSPKTNKNNIIIGKGYRISILSSSLFRIEISKQNHFNDEATQCIWFRDFYNVPFEKRADKNRLIIKTEKTELYFNIYEKKITKIILLNENKIVKNFHKQNLKGTARTLDMTWGKTRLNNGILSEKGVAVHDDSNSLLLVGGEIKERHEKERDYYIFAYGKEYRKCISDFYKLTGKTPLVPRYALGNWWSRYRAYTQQEYISLMENFIKENIPITVATIDMDWHWVNVNEKFGLNLKHRNIFQSEGWTGYSWNTDLFPDYKGFLNFLHKNNFKTTLNIHPADGVRSYEDMYYAMAKEMGINPETKQRIEFDITSSKFINAYFKVLHNPFEDEGVDFWWIDWQQGKNTKIKGLDPLWSLNHYHFLNSSRKNKRPLILSRYSGVGSHRYPLGFSGDTFMVWKTLKFQPYFTANAANIGYTWWSHDIGGHQFGIKNDELYLRWLQFGVFSPINRLHSTSHDLQGKEPWLVNKPASDYAKEFLQLRHRLLPYIYSMNYRTYNDGIALCEPMYYSYPEEENAYKYKNQYFFGSELLVAPVVSKTDKRIKMAKVDVWLPEGRWKDIFNGLIYNGGKVITMHRTLENLPVLAKEGAIIPFGNNKGNCICNPKYITFYIYNGNNVFTLYEDDGESMDYQLGKSVKSLFEIKNDNGTKFIIYPAKGDLYLIPGRRRYELIFKDIKNGNIAVFKNGEAYKEYEKTISNGCLIINVNISITDKIEILIKDIEEFEEKDFMEIAIEILSKYQKANLSKMILYRKIKGIKDKDLFVKKLKKMVGINKIVKGAIIEQIEK